MQNDHRVRLYHSALNGVRYVYGAPVTFSADPEVLAARHAALARMVERSRTA